MTDSKISDLTAVTSLTGASELAVNEGGTSKKATVTQLNAFTPAAPTVVAVTAEFTSTGVPTATLPTGHTTNDILVLVLQTSNEGYVSAPAGYTQLGPQNGLNTGAAALASRLCIFWKRDGGSESAPTIPDTGDHTYGFMFAIRGCPTGGDPFVFGGNKIKIATSTSGTQVRAATPTDNCLVVDIWAGNVDNASAEGSSAANADLASVTEQFDDGTTDGTGGFLYMTSGVKTNAGAVGATTVTWANTSSDIYSRIIFLPDCLDARLCKTPEIQLFYGSPTDTDDTWVRPTGARMVFVQLVDGGGSGSPGISTGTAEGGGGGGGGGYDEAWFNANQWTTVTVHAGKGGAATSTGGNPGLVGVLSEFDKGNYGPLTSISRITGTAAGAAASGNGGDGGSGSGRGKVSPAPNASRIDLTAASAGAALGGVGGRGSVTSTGPIGGSPADWGGGGGEGGCDTDAGIGTGLNGYSVRGGGGGSGGRTTTTFSVSGAGGGVDASGGAQGDAGNESTRLPYGGAGGVGGGSSVAAGGQGGFPGGGGGGGGGVANGNGGRGGHGLVMVTTFF